MTPAVLLEHLRQRGVSLAIEPQPSTAISAQSAKLPRVRLEAPAGAFTDELRAALIEHKPEVLALLTARAHAYTALTQAHARINAIYKPGCLEATKLQHPKLWERLVAAERATEAAILDGNTEQATSSALELEDLWRHAIASFAQSNTTKPQPRSTTP